MDNSIIIIAYYSLDAKFSQRKRNYIKLNLPHCDYNLAALNQDVGTYQNAL